MIAFCALGASFAGCNRLDVNSPSVRGIAYVHMDDVVKHDPLYPQLSQIDDAVAMVTLAGLSPRVPRGSAAQIAREDAQLRAEINDARNRVQDIVNAKRAAYEAREKAAITAALQAAGVRNANDVAASMGQVSQQQMVAAQRQAGHDFQTYQRSVVQQSNTAAGAMVRQLRDGAMQKLQAKSLQEQQTETNLSLKLSQEDAAKRLSIQTKLSMLALDPTTRAQLQSQLSAMTRRENDVVNAQRALDRRQFNAYRAQVTSRTNAAVQAQLSHINTETRTKLESRQNAVGAQLRSSLQPSQAITHVSPATQAQIRAITQQFDSQYQNDVQGVIAEYLATGDALEAQFATLHGADAAAAAAEQQEVDVLQQRRQALYEQIVARIDREARRLAAEKGLHVVFSDVTAAPGGYDLTNDLISDIESEHE